MIETESVFILVQRCQKMAGSHSCMQEIFMLFQGYWIISQIIQRPGIDLLDESSIGNTFYLEFFYDRNLIARPEVLIQP